MMVKRRILSLALTLALLLTMIPAGADVDAAEPVPNAGIEEGDTVIFGHYPQTAEGDDNTPIMWRVLKTENGKALLLSEKALDFHIYNNMVWHTTTETIKQLQWENCALRQWLNEDFMKKAFSDKEQSDIVTTYIANPSIYWTYDENGHLLANSSGSSDGIPSPVYYNNGGNDTRDKVFLLSTDEVKTLLDTDISLRKAVCTAYALAQISGGKTAADDETYCSWWLRSPGLSFGTVTHIETSGAIGYGAAGVTIRGVYYGRIDNNGSVDCKNAVRPALWANLDALEKTVPGEELKITRFIDPAGDVSVSKVDGIKTYRYSAPLYADEVTVNVEVTAGADWELYHDKACTVLMGKDYPHMLDEGDNQWYIKITKNGDSAIYGIILTKPSGRVRTINISYSSDKADENDKEIKIPVDFGWKLFDPVNSDKYDNRLATVGILLSASSERPSPSSVQNTFRELGFRDDHIRHRNFGEAAVGEIAYSYAGQEIYLGNGNKKLLVAIVCRGTTEFGDKLNDIASVAGSFYSSAENINRDVMDFVHDCFGYEYDHDLIFYVTGHSLGGAVSNILAVLLQQHTASENIFAYTFASPVTSTTKKSNVNIYNIINTEDVVPLLPDLLLLKTDGTRYGRDLFFNSKTSGVATAFAEITGGKNIDDFMGESDNFWLNLGNRIAVLPIVLSQHSSDTYLSYCLSNQVHGENDRYKITRLSVKCPVDIEILDQNGDSVAKIVNNGIIETSDRHNIWLVVQDDEKYIFIPEDTKYTLKLTGNDEGSMEYDVENIVLRSSEDNNVEEIKQYTNIELKPGKEMQTVISSGMSGDEVRLNLIERGEEVAEIQTDGSEISTHIHSYTAEAVQPTCTENGYTMHLCSCGDSYKDNFSAATGHKYVNGKCKRCGETLGPLPFLDVHEGAWYYTSVQYAYVSGMMNGVSASRFDPEGTMTRAMFVTVLGRMAGVDTSQYTGSSFKDVKPGLWYSPYIEWAYREKITSGMSKTEFGTNYNITREQMATLIANFVKSEGISLPDYPASVKHFKDENRLSSWAEDGLKLMMRSGIIKGDEKGYFNPQDFATRAQAAAIFERLAVRIEEAGAAR